MTLSIQQQLKYLSQARDRLLDNLNPAHDYIGVESALDVMRDIRARHAREIAAQQEMIDRRMAEKENTQTVLAAIEAQIAAYERLPDDASDPGEGRR